MKLLNLSSKSGRKAKKRVGRGNGSGLGTYSCRGMKGQSARSGGKRRPGFEGGQTPYLRKMPKLKGFKNPNHVEYQVVNTGQLEVFKEGSTVTKKDLLEKNLISKKNHPVKLLTGKGELKKKLKIEVDKASASAQKLVEVILPKAEKKVTSPKKSKEDV